MFNKNFADDGDSNYGPLVSEVIALPTGPQPLPTWMLFKLKYQSVILELQFPYVIGL